MDNEDNKNLKSGLLEYQQNNTDTKRNVMGCCEDWYDYKFAINETFTKDEIKNMSDKEIEDLVKLAEQISMGLF